MKKLSVNKKKKSKKVATHLLSDNMNNESIEIYDNKIEDELIRYFKSNYSSDDAEFFNEDIKVYKVTPVKFKLEVSSVSVNIENGK